MIKFICILYHLERFEFKCRTCKSITHVYPITSPNMNFKSNIINTLYTSKNLLYSSKILFILNI